MHLVAGATFHHWVTQFGVREPVNSAHPCVAHAIDNNELAGTSIGNMTSSSDVALFELLERRHFFGGVRPGGSQRLDEMLKLPALDGFVRCLTQTCHEAARGDVRTHSFGSTVVRNLGTDEPLSIPTMFLRGDAARCPDERFLPVRDSSGTAVYSNASEALGRAMLEFMERQCLVGAWLKRVPRIEIEGDFVSVLGPTNAAAFRHLFQAGRVLVFDITFGLDCYATMAIYQSLEAGETVQYAIGLSCALDPDTSLRRTLNELIHSYFAMHSLHAASKSPKAAQKLNRLDKYFLDANRPDTLEKFGFSRADNTQRAVKKLTNYLGRRSYSYEDLKKTILSHSNLVYYYLVWHSYGPRVLFYSRVVSPEFYIHIDPLNNLNLNNAYARAIGAPTEYGNRGPLPFP